MKFLSSARSRTTTLIAASMLAGGLMTGTAMAIQDHMLSALHSLQIARNQLAIAIPDKAGNRLRAISLVDEAISAVNAGITAGAE